MSKECVLFDCDGKEIDWFDPVEIAEEIAKFLIITMESNGNNYLIPRSDYFRFEIREIK